MAPAINQIKGGAMRTQPACSAHAQAIKHIKAPVHASHEGTPFNRPHSQAAAAIKMTVKAIKGQAEEANKAGNSKASKTKAVMTLCLSMNSPEKRPPMGGLSGREKPRRRIQTQTAMISCSLAETN
jgi:hypothetical protein